MPEPALFSFVETHPAVAQLGHFGRAILRCRDNDIDKVSHLLGVALPQDPCRSAAANGLNALWLGPDEWLLLGENTDRLTAVEWGSIPVSLVDVSHRQVAFSIQGHFAEKILAAGCALDLVVSAFPVGMCTRTTFAKSEIILWRTSPTDFHLEVWHSFSRYVEALLRAAEKEMLFSV